MSPPKGTPGLQAGEDVRCPNRGDGNHRHWNGDPNNLGALVATVRGWECPFCDYTQRWAPAQNAPQ